MSVPTVSVDQVSKRYQLGLTRTSVLSWLRHRAARLVGSGRRVDRAHLWALRDASFTLDAGESLALVGPNGAGKTTLLRLLAGITYPTTGTIAVRGRLSALIELGAGFHPDLTGRENVFLNGTILGLGRSEIRRRFDEIVAFAELDDFIDTPVKRYSSGMAVRLGFSVAACVEPQVLLVDEVLAVGDSRFRQKCIDRIRTLLSQGTSLVFVSHNMWLVQAVCKRSLYINHGRVVLDADTASVIERYDRDVHRERLASLEVGDDMSATDAPDIEIQRVTVRSEGGDDRTELDSGLPAEVRVQYRAYRDVGPIHAVVRLIRSDGLTCCMMRTRVDRFGLRAHAGDGILSLRLDPIQLSGGGYVAQAILRDATDSWPLSSVTSAPFYVSSAVLTHQEMNGVFEPLHTWKHESNPASAPVVSVPSGR